MTFDNVTFPNYPMLRGVEKIVTDPVSKVGNGTYEYRVKKTRWERYAWKIPTQTMTNEQKEAIREFLTQRNHELNSFKFVDPTATALADAILSHNSGDYWNLALPFSSTTAGTHPIFNPEIGGLSVTVDAIADSINAFTILNGIPVIQITGTSGSEVVKVTGPIHFTVRLNSDFQTTLHALDFYNGTNDPYGHVVNDIELVEVFGEV